MIRLPLLTAVMLALGVPASDQHPAPTEHRRSGERIAVSQSDCFRPDSTPEIRVMPSDLAGKLLGVLDQLSGGVHPGFRPVHAKGVMFSGTFVPAPDAAELTRAPHASRPSTPLTVRFSASSGITAVADNASEGSSPQGMATRFHLAEHVHTDIIAHSFNGFPARSGEEVLEFFQAVAASGPGAPTPPPIVAFLATHPVAKAFVEAPKPIPSSLARQPYFAVNAFKFTNAGGAKPIRPIPLYPRCGDRVPDPRSSEPQDGRLPRRRDVGAFVEGSGDLPRAGANRRGR